jgi:hypothetical protein
MKKLILLTLVTFIFFSVSSSFALTIKTKSSPPKAKPETTSTSTVTTTQPVKQPEAEAKRVAGAYEKCLNVEMKNLTKELQERKKSFREEYINAVKSATSTEAKREAIKAYKTALRDIQKWFNQATKEAKAKCKSTVTTIPVTTTPSTETSTQ